jgi:hypothetical protein
LFAAFSIADGAWPADEILNSLTDYLAKLGPGSPANRQD